MRWRTTGKTRLIIFAMIGLVAIASVVASADGLGSRSRRAQPTPIRSSAAVVSGGSTAVASLSPTGLESATPASGLPATTSADMYATEAATTLWTVDYAASSRQQVLNLWQNELAETLPEGTPSGTTVAQAQAAAMSTLEAYLPNAASWSNLASDSTKSAFAVTSVAEPPSWVAAVATGAITDPGLTARTVIGIQTLSYGAGTSARVTTLTQQITIAMLCPPTVANCRLEIIPPRDSAGSTN